jgi:hypothetical protein
VIDDKLKQVLCVCLSVPPFAFSLFHFRTERYKLREGARISAVQLKRLVHLKMHDCAVVNACRFLSKSHFVSSAVDYEQAKHCRLCVLVFAKSELGVRHVYPIRST